MKKLRIILIIFLAVAALSFKLYYNKVKLDKNSKLADNQQLTVPVRLIDVKKMKINLDFTESGSFSASHELVLLSESQGRVSQLLVHTGDFVREGQVIAKLDEEIARSQYALAELNFNKLTSDMLKYQELLKGHAITNQQFEEAKISVANAKTNLAMAKKTLENTVIKAPIQGTITKRYIEKGSLLTPGAMVVEIVDISNLKFTTSISESQLSFVYTGQKVMIKASAGKDEYNGIVRMISVKADDAKRYELEIEVANKSAKTIRSGMEGIVLFRYDNPYEALVIPRKCLIGSIKEPVVYMIENHKARTISIKTGIMTDDYVEVMNGLNENDKVVINGQINLHNGSIVTFVL